MDLYYFVRYLLKFILHVFFRDVEVVNKNDNIPKEGAVIFVGNHQNQFVDPAMLITQIDRPVSFLIAEKSMHRQIVGQLARALHAIPVRRAQDNAIKGIGSITSVGDTVNGSNTQFKSTLKVGDQIHITGFDDPPSVTEIIDESTIKVSPPFEPAISTPTSFKIWKKMDQKGVYDKVWEALANGECIGIFPEGGSHDRTALLPLKAGVTIMALGAMAKYGINVSIVPCGLNYFRGHKFRSEVLVEFGKPINISSELVDKYKTNKREACIELLDVIQESMKHVTLNCPDFNTLQSIFMARRLYQPPNLKLPIEQFLELNRRFAEGYLKLVKSDDARVLDMKQKIDDYCLTLKMYGLNDHQVLALPPTDTIDRFSMAFGRIVFLVIFILLALPGLIINLPAILLVKQMALKEAKKAKKNSTVKIAGRDVIASYKIITAMVFLPITHAIWGSVVAHNYGLFWGLLSALFIQPTMSYASVRLSERGMDIWKASLPVFRSIWYGGNDYVKDIQKQRFELQEQVRQYVNEAGPKIFGKSFESMRIIKLEEIQDASLHHGVSASKRRAFAKQI